MMGREEWRVRADPTKRTRSWRLTMELPELRRLLSSGTLRNHADRVRAEVYADGVKQAVIETGLVGSVFATECPYTLPLGQEFVVEEPPEQ